VDWVGIVKFNCPVLISAALVVFRRSAFQKRGQVSQSHGDVLVGGVCDEFERPPMLKLKSTIFGCLRHIVEAGCAPINSTNFHANIG
jgi:hypothetical protein